MTRFQPKDYWNERLGTTPSLEAVGYLGLGPGYNRWMYRLREHVFRSTVKKLAPPVPRRVCDVGAGSGVYIEAWRRVGATSVTGLDIAPNAVRSLERRFPWARFLELDIGDGTGPLEPASFDAVSCLDVLIHIVDEERYRAAFNNLTSLLVPGGHLILTDVITDQALEPGRHVRFRSLRVFREAYQAAGLSLVTQRPTFRWMAEPVRGKMTLRRPAWNLFRATIQKLPALGGPAGAALYALERATARLPTAAPSSELFVFRRGEPT